MSDHITRARAWFHQASSDARTARALVDEPAPMYDWDVGCHVSALCAQALEKSIKGAVVLNKQTPDMTHRADKYFAVMLGAKQLFQSPVLRNAFFGIFDQQARAHVRTLLDLTPGAVGSKNVPNTEYPWVDDGTHRTPAGATVFADRELVGVWVATARRVAIELGRRCGDCDGARSRKKEMTDAARVLATAFSGRRRRARSSAHTGNGSQSNRSRRSRSTALVMVRCGRR